ncbi:Cbb3-type cytochrome oxidase component FixQ [Solitalea canadensis]|uniref:Cbb3-type cytochrome oxidase component FixQ n=1 Tax=Solitalea canadensis (strain ATCC 29591 / DSM 3403 / JCM 21819 / LMG 8368 / NBRC 15130 / NCIMB 12057 / USAM 9D) TaxID=929556 RepID=H8KTM0_SOLCM|nr:Cbb3-type cytochrome oxidase component FixQ [Solitalea canadensis]AFD06478.1 Cbb3-type cytochrome oxidase component FixQ [Solitalea canadensis DSM 3403]
MKFINYLESISGVGVYPMISFMIFFIFFIGLGVYVFKTPKRYIDEVSNIPLDGTDIN